MAIGKIIVKVRLAWWVMPYVNTLLFFCRVFHTEPDYDKLTNIIKRGVVYEGIR